MAHHFPSGPGVPGGMRTYLQNLMKSNSLLKHLLAKSVKRTQREPDPQTDVRCRPRLTKMPGGCMTKEKSSSALILMTSIGRSR